MAQQQLGQQAGTVDDGCQSRGIVHRAPLHESLGHSVSSVNVTALGRKSVRWVPVRLGTVALNAASLVFLVMAWLFLQRFINDAGDAHAYWLTRSGITYGTTGTPDAYLYSPLFAQIIRPLTILPWPVFFAVWTALLFGALIYLAGPPLAALLLALPLVSQEIITGNIQLFLAVAVVMAFRHPAAWSAVLLTKVTPGVGMLWHAIRREWRALCVAAAVTLTLVVVSVALDAQAWVGWIGALTHSTSTPGSGIPVPLSVRLPLALAIVGIGAWRGWRWSVIVSAALAVPVLWSWYPVMLLGLLPLLRERVAANRVLVR